MVSQPIVISVRNPSWRTYQSPKKEMFETANKQLAVIPMPFYMGNLHLLMQKHPHMEVFYGGYYLQIIQMRQC
jgi:hypothetical protein